MTRITLMATDQNKNKYLPRIDADGRGSKTINHKGTMVCQPPNPTSPPRPPFLRVSKILVSLSSYLWQVWHSWQLA